MVERVAVTEKPAEMLRELAVEAPTGNRFLQTPASRVGAQIRP